MFGFLASKCASENMSSHRAIIFPPELLLLEPTAAHGTDGRLSPCQVPHFKREPTEKIMLPRVSGAPGAPRRCQLCT